MCFTTSRSQMAQQQASRSAQDDASPEALCIVSCTLYVWNICIYTLYVFRVSPNSPVSAPGLAAHTWQQNALVCVCLLLRSLCTVYTRHSHIIWFACAEHFIGSPVPRYIIMLHYAFARGGAESKLGLLSCWFSWWGAGGWWDCLGVMMMMWIGNHHPRPICWLVCGCLLFVSWYCIMYQLRYHTRFNYRKPGFYVLINHQMIAFICTTGFDYIIDHQLLFSIQILGHIGLVFSVI